MSSLRISHQSRAIGSPPSGAENSRSDPSDERASFAIALGAASTGTKLPILLPGGKTGDATDGSTAPRKRNDSPAKPTSGESTVGASQAALPLPDGSVVAPAGRSDAEVLGASASLVTASDTGTTPSGGGRVVTASGAFAPTSASGLGRVLSGPRRVTNASPTLPGGILAPTNATTPATSQVVTQLTTSATFMPASGAPASRGAAVTPTSVGMTAMLQAATQLVASSGFTRTSTVMQVEVPPGTQAASAAFTPGSGSLGPKVIGLPVGSPANGQQATSANLLLQSGAFAPQTSALSLMAGAPNESSDKIPVASGDVLAIGVGAAGVSLDAAADSATAMGGQSSALSLASVASAISSVAATIQPAPPATAAFAPLVTATAVSATEAASTPPIAGSPAPARHSIGAPGPVNSAALTAGAANATGTNAASVPDNGSSTGGIVSTSAVPHPAGALAATMSDLAMPAVAVPGVAAAVADTSQDVSQPAVSAMPDAGAMSKSSGPQVGQSLTIPGLATAQPTIGGSVVGGDVSAAQEERGRSAPTTAVTGAGDIAASAGSGANGPVATPASTSSTEPAPTVDASPSGTISDQIAGHLVRMVSSGTRDMVMRLHPPELGDVTVRVAISGRDVSAWFAAPQPQVQSAINAALGQLQTSLDNAGYNLNGAWVGADTSDARQQQPSPMPLQAPSSTSAVVRSTAAPSSPSTASGLNIYV
jgi:flagellar hook-length control protein FliK